MISYSREEWYEWALKSTPSSARRYLSKLDRLFSGVRSVSSPEELRRLIRGFESDRHAMLALRNYVRFLEQTGRLRRSEAEDYRAVIPCIPTRPRPEVERSVSEEDVARAFRSIRGSGKVRRVRELFFRMLFYTGLRETEVTELISQFSPLTLQRTVSAFDPPERVALYDLEAVTIPTRRSGSKRCYVAIFPAWLADELEELRGVRVRQSTVRRDRMFQGEGIDLSLLRKFHYNWFLDNSVGRVADALSIVEFMQGRAPRTVGGRSYRANVKAAARLYDELLDDYSSILER